MSIQITCEQDMHIVEVRNPGDGSIPGAAFPAGHALDNIRRRLRLLYGERASLELLLREDGVCAALRIPCAS
ncbi:MAG: hypothetical protein QM757_21440 [Paludibaculum sp.]